KPPFFTSGADRRSSPIFGCVAAPIRAYGVVLFVKYDGDRSKVYLYKHSATPGTPLRPEQGKGTAPQPAGKTDADADFRRQAPGIARPFKSVSPAQAIRKYLADRMQRP